jgi:hypothetical protein
MRRVALERGVLWRTFGTFAQTVARNARRGARRVGTWFSDDRGPPPPPGAGTAGARGPPGDRGPGPSGAAGSSWDPQATADPEAIAGPQAIADPQETADPGPGLQARTEHPGCQGLLVPPGPAGAPGETIVYNTVHHHDSGIGRAARASFSSSNANSRVGRTKGCWSRKSRQHRWPRGGAANPRRWRIPLLDPTGILRHLVREALRG